MIRLKQFGAVAIAMYALIATVGGLTFQVSGYGFWAAPHLIYLAACSVLAAKTVGLTAVIDRHNQRPAVVAPAVGVGTVMVALLIIFAAFGMDLRNPMSIMPLTVFPLGLGGLGTLLGLGGLSAVERLARRKPAPTTVR